MSGWDDVTKERIRELVTIETVGIFFDWQDMEPEYVRRMIQIRDGIGMERSATKKLEGILSKMPVGESGD